MQVKELMTRGVECVLPGDNIAAAAQKMKDLDVGALPVCGDDGRLKGMITDRDITVRATAGCCDPGGTRVQDVMTPNIIYAFEDQGVSEASGLMKENQIRRLVVLNRDKRLVGIVSLGDLAVKTGDGRERCGWESAVPSQGLASALTVSRSLTASRATRALNDASRISLRRAIANPP
jgi:CBS domain-containing protein